MLQCLDHIGHEALGMQVNNLGGRVVLENKVTHGVHKMGLTQTNTAVEK